MIPSIELRETQWRWLKICEADRRWLARELHHGLAQTLTEVGLLCKELERRPSVTKEEREVFGRMHRAVLRSIWRTRALSRLAFPVSLGNGDLGRALETLAVDITRNYDCNCVLERGVDIRLGDVAIAVQVFSIVQEAIVHALCDRGSRSIRLCLDSRDRIIEIAVEDDGADADGPAPEDADGELAITRSRAEIVGATIRRRRLSASGSILLCSVPT